MLNEKSKVIFVVNFEKIALSVEDLQNAGPFGRTAIYDALNSGELKGKKKGDRTIIPVWRAVEWIDGLPDYPATPYLCVAIGNEWCAYPCHCEESWAHGYSRMRALLRAPATVLHI